MPGRLLIAAQPHVNEPAGSQQQQLSSPTNSTAENTARRGRPPSRRSSTNDPATIAKRFASKNIKAALDHLDSLLEKVPPDAGCRFAEYAWLFACCSVRLKPPFDVRVKAVGNKLLSMWQHARQRTSDTYLEDVWAYRSAKLLGFVSDVELQPDPSTHNSWRKRQHPDLLQDDEGRYNRWDLFLEHALDVWAIIGLVGDAEEDRRSWSYIRHWEARLHNTVSEMKPQLARANFPLWHALSLVSCIAYLILMATSYGTSTASEDDASYIKKHYHWSLDRVAGLFADDALDIDSMSDRAEAVMEIVFAYALLGKSTHAAIDEFLNRSAIDDIDIPGLYENPTDWTYWAKVHRVFCCVFGVASWAGLVEDAKRSPSVFSNKLEERTPAKAAPNKPLTVTVKRKGQSSALKKPARRRKTDVQKDDLPKADSVLTEGAQNTNVESVEQPATPSWLAPGDSSWRFQARFLVGDDAGHDRDAAVDENDGDGEGLRSKDSASFGEQDAASNGIAASGSVDNGEVQHEDGPVEDCEVVHDSVENSEVPRDDGHILDLLDVARAQARPTNTRSGEDSCEYRSLMPPRRVTRFAFTAFDSIPTDASSLVTNGIVQLPGLLRDEMSRNTIYERIASRYSLPVNGFTIGLFNKESTSGQTNSNGLCNDWDDVSLFIGIRDQILPLLSSKLGPMSLVRDHIGNELRSVRVCLRTEGEHFEKRCDMHFYDENLPHLNGVAFRIYTVWILLTNSTSIPPLRFIDGSGCRHESPATAGDVVVYNSCIQFEGPMVPMGRSISFDFGVLVEDLSY